MLALPAISLHASVTTRSADAVQTIEPAVRNGPRDVWAAAVDDPLALSSGQHDAERIAAATPPDAQPQPWAIANDQCTTEGVIARRVIYKP